eukprot:m51a1_g9844 hypothetical protein (605) ;mRNA; r:1957605-1959687
MSAPLTQQGHRRYSSSPAQAPQQQQRYGGPGAAQSPLRRTVRAAAAPSPGSGTPSGKAATPGRSAPPRQSPLRAARAAPASKAPLPPSGKPPQPRGAGAQQQQQQQQRAGGRTQQAATQQQPPARVVWSCSCGKSIVCEVDQRLRDLLTKGNDDFAAALAAAAAVLPGKRPDSRDATLETLRAQVKELDERARSEAQASDTAIAALKLQNTWLQAELERLRPTTTAPEQQQQQQQETTLGVPAAEQQPEQDQQRPQEQQAEEQAQAQAPAVHPLSPVSAVVPSASAEEPQPLQGMKASEEAPATPPPESAIALPQDQSEAQEAPQDNGKPQEQLGEAAVEAQEQQAQEEQQTPIGQAKVAQQEVAQDKPVPDSRFVIEEHDTSLSDAQDEPSQDISAAETDSAALVQRAAGPDHCTTAAGASNAACEASQPRPLSPLIVPDAPDDLSDVSDVSPSPAKAAWEAPSARRAALEPLPSGQDDEERAQEEQEEEQADEDEEAEAEAEEEEEEEPAWPPRPWPVARASIDGEAPQVSPRRSRAEALEAMRARARRIRELRGAPEAHQRALSEDIGDLLHSAQRRLESLRWAVEHPTAAAEDKSARGGV